MSTYILNDPSVNWTLNATNINFTNNQIKIGNFAGQTNQSTNAIAIGQQAGQTNQGINAVDIGQQAGAFSQGLCSIAIGYLAGPTGQNRNSIILNATGTGMTGGATGTYIAPIRNSTQQNVLGYNTSTNELTYYNPSWGNTNILYDDFFSCPSNNPNTPLGPLGIQASTTSTFLSPYTGTKISGKCGVIKLLNPTSAGTGVPWEIYNAQPISFSDLPIIDWSKLYNVTPNPISSQTLGWSMTHKFFQNGTSDASSNINTNVRQFIGIFGGTGGTGPLYGVTGTFPTPNFYLTVDASNSASLGYYGVFNWYKDNVDQNPVPSIYPYGFTNTTLLENWYTLKFIRTGTDTFNISGFLATSGTWSNINSPLYLRCGSYGKTGTAITQNTYTYVDFTGVELNTRTS